MRYIGAFTPQAKPSGNFDLKATIGKVLFSNESCSNLLIKFSSGFNFKLPAGGNRLLCINEQSSNITYSTISQLNVACIDAVDVEVYDPSEEIVESYPSAMTRQTIIGNGVQLGTAANQLINTTTNPGNNVITIRPTDVVVGNTWLADNSGNLLINSDNAGVLTQLLQLIAGVTPKINIAASGVLTEVMDKLQIDNDAFVSGNHALGTGGLLFSTLVGGFGLSVMGQANLDNGKIFTDGLGTIEFGKSAVSVNGSVSGTASLFTPVWGGSLKIAILTMSGYNSVNIPTFLFPSSANFGLFYVGNIGASMTFAWFNGGAIQTVDILTFLGTGGSAGSSGSATNIHGNAIGQLLSVADRVIMGDTGGSSHTASIIFIGV